MAILDREQQGERVVVGAWGELDLASATEFEAKLRQAIKGSASGVVLDLGGVTFMDSAGLHVLISAAAVAHGTGRQLIVLRGSEQVRQVIEMSGVSDLLPLAD